MRAKMNGCGATYCKFNTVGECSLNFIILGERGECLFNEPDAEKIADRQRLEALVTEVDEPEVKPNVIGFRGGEQ